MSEKTKCVNCGNVGEFTADWCEVDDGDLCPTCTAEWRTEQEAEIRLQDAELA